MPPVPPQADIAELLEQSRRLLDSAISTVTTHRSAEQMVRITPDARWGADLQRMLRDVRAETTLAISSPIRLERRYSRGGTLLQELHRTGKQVRLLLSPGYAGTREPDLYSRAFQLNSQVRVTSAEFCNTIIIDRRTAVLWNGPETGDPRGLIVTEPMVIQAIHEFTVRAWSASRQFRDHLREAEFDEVSIAVVNFLNTGLKDEVAARKLGISLRTYRRHVADLMLRLDTATRFQLGVRAAELGLLR
ncbi:hypothetical protein GFY24_18800 [Nocardia sp. SYP-A9097]|uniref:response regulator transcription factor n=1 Tax=Nocardia sp. SYP-A9097 TaxID=2663237 RepID=UPI00129BF689|nr:response regulator transcription factor [Nocardia sp. SYP-A9097]MRH89470.1 hypothetical protein [Nocardia sp. SYP-A9097]